MDLSTSAHHLGKNTGGFTLTMEEKAGLEVAMLARQKEESLPAPLFFGKIFGEVSDYLVVYFLISDKLNPFPVKKFYYCTTGSYILKALPSLSSEYITLAKSLDPLAKFKGDPSFLLDGGEEEADDENITTERFRELHRLAYVVNCIDHDVSIVPRGALYLDAAHYVKETKGYTGLSHGSCTNLKSFLHYRKPEKPASIIAMEKEGIARSGDFLDSIDEDEPKGSWTVTWDESMSTVYVKSLLWGGYSFYHVAGSGQFGGAYFGYGSRNEDIAFMI